MSPKPSEPSPNITNQEPSRSTFTPALGRDLVDWTHGFVQGLLEDHYLTTSQAVLLDQLAAALSALRVGDTRECDEAVHDPEWAEVRRLARQALEEFRALGVTIPDLGLHLLRGVESVPASEREPSDLIR